MSYRKTLPPHPHIATSAHQALPSTDSGVLPGLSPEKTRLLDQKPVPSPFGKPLMLRGELPFDTSCSSL